MNLFMRSYQPELLDSDLIPFAHIKQNLKELNFINTWLGGHKISIDAFRQIAGKKKEMSICEIGCGGGDNLISINNWCKKRNIKISITGVDIKQECIDFARTRNNFLSTAKWITSDYRLVTFDQKPDVIFSSLFCHHFTEEQLAEQLQWMKTNSSVGFFINDLQRNLIAYYAIKILTKLFSRSYLVKNDAPLSVARGFSRCELSAICKQAKIENAQISWKWAFRFLVIFKHD